METQIIQLAGTLMVGHGVRGSKPLIHHKWFEMRSVPLFQSDYSTLVSIAEMMKEEMKDQW